MQSGCSPKRAFQLRPVWGPGLQPQSRLLLWAAPPPTERVVGAMLVTKTVILAAQGQYGPFDDGRVIPYIEVVDPDGGGVFRATATQTVVGNPPAIMERCTVDLEFFMRDNGIKLRYTRIEPEKAAPKAA